jgi:CRISPR-associated protein Cmr5
MPQAQRRKLEQERAAHAYFCASDAKAKLNEKYKEYVGWVKKLPAMISTNGLGQAMAFLAAKAKTKNNAPNTSTVEGMVYVAIESWLIRSGKPYSNPLDDEVDVKPVWKLLYRIIHRDSVTYRYATAEAMAYLAWLKSLSDSLLEKKEEDS